MPLVIHINLANYRYAEFKLIAALEAHAVLHFDHVKSFPVKNVRVELELDFDPWVLDSSFLVFPDRRWPHLHDVSLIFGCRVKSAEGQSSMTGAAPKVVLELFVIIVYRLFNLVCAVVCALLVPPVREERFDLLFEHLT